jgi:uncharacterized protein
MSTMAVPNITLPEEAIRAFCKQWDILEFALFGSVLRDDFGPESDIDVLVTFAPGARWSVLDHIQMEAQLSDLLGRRVEISNRRAIEESRNWIVRREILMSARPLYVR